MKSTSTITSKDYRQARFMINNITDFAPANSQAARNIVKIAEKIIILYHLQQKNALLSSEKKSMANLLGKHVSNAKLFFEVRAATHQHLK